MEDCVPNSLWIVRVSGHVLRPYKRSCILPIFYEVFKDILDVCVVVCLDDILIYSDNLDKHLKHLRKILRRNTKVEECSFSVNTTNCLSFVIGPDGLRMETPKIQSIRDLPTPRKGKDVQSSLGFANFYRRFTASYSDTTVPLTELTRKDAPWVWSPQCEPFNSSKRPLVRYTSSRFRPIPSSSGRDRRL